MKHDTRALLATAVLAPLLAGCWWFEGEPEPGEWRHSSGTIADFQPHHVATLYEANGYARLHLECSSGPITFFIETDRPPVAAHFRVTARYRLDAAPPVVFSGYSSGNDLWFRDSQQAIGEDEMVARIVRSRRLMVRIDWTPTERQTMQFDTSQAGPAVERLRTACAASAARKGGNR